MSKTVLFQTIQLSICTQFSSIWPIDRTLSGANTSEWTLEWWQWRGPSHSPKLQHYWSFTIRLFSVISGILIGEVLHFCRDSVSVSYSPNWLGNFIIGVFWLMIVGSSRMLLSIKTDSTQIIFLIWINIMSINSFLDNTLKEN